MTGDILLMAPLGAFAFAAGAVMAAEVRDAALWVTRKLGFIPDDTQQRPPVLSRDQLDGLCRLPLEGRVIDRVTAGFAGWDVIDAEILAGNPPDGIHLYAHDPETRMCRECSAPEADRIHRRRTA